MLARGMVQQGGIPSRGAGPGDILASGEVIGLMTADANSTITAAIIAGGMVRRSGQSAGRTDTTDTADAVLVGLGGNDYSANILPGTVFKFIYQNTVAQVITWAHGRGWVAGLGVLDVAASAVREYFCKVLNTSREVVRTCATTIATPDVVLAEPQPAGTITPGMLVSAAAGITAGTRVAGVHYGSTANRDNTDKIVRITLDQNAITASDPAKSITFSPVIEINGIRASTL